VREQQTINIVSSAAFLGRLGPHLTQCGLGRGLPPYQVASWSIQPFGHNSHGPKLGAVPLWGRGARFTSNTVCRTETYLYAKFHLDPSNRLATIHQRYRQAGQTVNGPITYGEPFYKRSPKKVQSRMWADAQRNGSPAEYSWRPLLNAAKFGWCPLFMCRAVTLPIQENARLGRKVNFAPGRIPLADRLTAITGLLIFYSSIMLCFCTITIL